MKTMRSIKNGGLFLGTAIAILVLGLWRIEEGTNPGLEVAAADSGSPPVIRYADLDGPQRHEAFKRLRQTPTILRFEQGDRIPVQIDVDSSVIGIEGESTLWVAVRSPFYVKIRQEGEALFSAEGKSYEAYNVGDRLALGLSVSDSGRPLFRAILSTRSTKPEKAPRQ
jgi:hypothetical protein